jgi:hypothetical protein
MGPEYPGSLPGKRLTTLARWCGAALRRGEGEEVHVHLEVDRRVGITEAAVSVDGAFARDIGEIGAARDRGEEAFDARVVASELVFFRFAVGDAVVPGRFDLPDQEPALLADVPDAEPGPQLVVGNIEGRLVFPFRSGG